MSAGDLTKLFPAAEDAPRIAPRAAYGALELAQFATAERPYVIVNMVATADGQARYEGDTSELGDEADLELFVTLREQVDCVMAGVRTVRIENYKGPGGKAETRARREANGLSARPLFATATRSGVLPGATPLFQDPEARIVVFSNAERLDDGGAVAQIEQVRTEDPAAMLAALRHDYGVRSLLLEGGPHINTPFFAAELVDELFLTLAPMLIGGAEAFPIIAGDLPEPQKLHLISVLFDNEHLYLRYRVD